MSITNIPPVEQGHNVNWDLKYNRPTIINLAGPGYKVINPHTGAIEAAGQEGTRAGPPGIDFYIHNIRRGPGDIFRGGRSTLFSTSDEALVEIEEHVRKGLYSIDSLNACG